MDPSSRADGAHVDLRAQISALLHFYTPSQVLAALAAALREKTPEIAGVLLRTGQMVERLEAARAARG